MTTTTAKEMQEFKRIERWYLTARNFALVAGAALALAYCGPAPAAQPAAGNGAEYKLTREVHTVNGASGVIVLRTDVDCPLDTLAPAFPAGGILLVGGDYSMLCFTLSRDGSVTTVATTDGESITIRNFRTDGFAAERVQ